MTANNNQTGTGMAGEDIERVLPCACQSSPVVVTDQRPQVTCFHCGRRGPASEYYWLAIKLWNNDRKGVTAING